MRLALLLFALSACHDGKPSGAVPDAPNEVDAAVDVDAMTTIDDDDPEPANLHIFDPADYPGYDATGATEASAAFQAAIDAASAYATSATTGLYDPTVLTKPDGTVVGPHVKQAVVRTAAHGVFKLHNVYIKSNVRLEIDASSTLIPVHATQQVMLYASETGTSYVQNVTLTGYGSSPTFQDTGRRCTAAGMSSPCALPKHVQYSGMKFRDGTGWATGGASDLSRRFVLDLDYRRYPDSNPPQETGDGPRGSGIKLRLVKFFLVEKMLELANPGEILTPNDNPSGPGGIGSNTYPATAGNGIAISALPVPDGGMPDISENAPQPRNGTVRYAHCEGCTRGYGIIEIHAGVDLEYEHISTRGGIAVRWESAENGQSTRQTARQIVGYDCNVPLMMSPHMFQQVQLEAYDVVAVGCDNGFRTESPGGDTKSSSITRLDVYASNAEDDGQHAQVIRCRFANCDNNFGSSNYDDDAWNFLTSTYAVNNNNSRPTSSITISQVRCTDGFVHGNVGFGACSGL